MYTQNRDVEAGEPDQWSTTDEPTLFRAYLQDLDARQLISGVKVTALRSGISTTSDADGLFTLEIPASYRKGKSPSAATETLVFSRPGYRRFEYRDLVLHPGVNSLGVLLEKGTGTAVRRNRSIHNSGYSVEDEFSEFKGSAREALGGNRGEIISLEIEPSSYDGGWILCKPGAKVILKGRNLKSVELLWYPTGTGMGLMGPRKAGPMKKVRTSPQEDTWELDIPDVMTTHFWAQGIDTNGETVKSMDLGNVGWEQP